MPLVLFGRTGYGEMLGLLSAPNLVLNAVAPLAFALLLLGRARFGWRGRKAVRILYVGSLLLLLAYVGSRFVLEVVLGRAT